MGGRQADSIGRLVRVFSQERLEDCDRFVVTRFRLIGSVLGPVQDPEVVVHQGQVGPNGSYLRWPLLDQFAVDRNRLLEQVARSIGLAGEVE